MIHLQPYQGKSLGGTAATGLSDIEVQQQSHSSATDQQTQPG